MCDMTNPIFQNEDKARSFLEAQRWPDGPHCPSCGQLDSVKTIPAKSMMSKPSKKNPVSKPQKGWHHCNECRKRFTVRTGTLADPKAFGR